MPLTLARLLLGAQAARPSSRKLPPVAVVLSTVLYFVRVRIAQAVNCAQPQLVSGYCTVPLPIVTTTGAVMVAVVGIVCATTRQYFSPSL